MDRANEIYQQQTLSMFEYFFLMLPGEEALMLNQPVHAQTSRLYMGYAGTFELFGGF
ncbi:MAG: hypothetical protein KGY60_10905 [Bacteroidales bacterium]|nr:hypothetical protein [Bacteroidales bacterium]